MANKQIRREIYITANGKVAEDVLKALDTYAKKLDQDIQQLIKDGKAETKECKELVAVQKSLGKQMKDNISDTQRIDKVMKDLAGSSTRQLRSALNAVRREMERTSESSGKLGELRKQFKAIKEQIDKNTGAVNKHGSAWSTAAKNLVAYVGLFGAFNTLKSKLTEVLNLNFKYSDSLANIRKVSNMSMKSVNELSNQLAKLDTRTSLEGLTQLAYMGSRLGMSKYGVQGLADFAKAADRVGVALKEDLGDDAMLILSKLVETMGDVERHGGNISDAFDAVSSSIFKLASSSTSNGATIVEFAKRLTGLAKVTHVTTEQLLALGSASDSLMLMPEVSSTAFNKFISSLWDNYRNIEDMLGMQRDSLKKDIQEGQTMTALIKVLKSISDENLNSLDGMFKEFGSEGSRLKQVIVAMAQNVGVLEDHLKTSTKAYKEAIAVTQEYNIQQETAQAVLERANNMWEKAFVNPQGIDAVKEMAKLWYDFSKTLTQSETFLGTVKGLLWSLQFSVKALLAVMPPLIAYFGTKGLTTVLGKLPALIAMLTGSGLVKYFTMLIGLLTRFSVTVRAVSIAWHGMNLAMRANFLGAIATTVTVVVAGFWKLHGVLFQTTQSYTKLSNSVGEANKQYLIEQRALGNMANAILRAKKGTQERTAAIQNFNKAYGPYLSKLLTEANAAQNIAKAYREAAAAIREKTYAEMRQKDYDKNVRPRLEREVSSQNDLNEFARTTKNSRLRFANGDWAIGIAQQNKNHEEAFQQALARMRRSGAKITDDQAAYIWGRRSSGLTDEGHAKNIHVYSNKSKSYEWNALNDDMRQLHMVAQTIERNFATRYFDRKQNEIWGDKGLKDSEQVTETIKLKDPTVNTKGGSGSGKSNNDMTIAKDRANALIANIKAFYEEQERAYLEWVAKMNEKEKLVSDEAQARRISEFEENKKRALGTARQSIATLGTEWETYLKDELPKHMFNKDDEVSKQLVEAMGKSDIKGLHALFEKLSGDLSRENNRTLSENLGALLDQIFANGSKELREAAEKLLERQRELYAILNRDKFVDNVNQQTRGNLDKWQFLTPANGIDANTEQGQRQLSQGFRELISKTRSQVHDLYEMLLVEDEKKFEDQMHAFLAAATQNFDFSNIKGKELHALLLMLIDDERNYEKALKDTDAQMKQRNDEAWLKSDENKEMTKTINGVENALAFQKMYGKPKSNIEGNDKETLQTSWRGVGEGMGFEFKIDNDPELLLIEERMKREREAFMEKQRLHELGKASDEEYNESLKTYLSSLSAYSDRVLQDISSQTDALMSFMSPIMSFGEAVGDAFATMREDSEQGKKAMQNALKQMIKSFATQSLQLIMKNEQEQANMASHYAVMQAMRQAFNQAELQEENTNSTALLAAKQANDNKELNLDAIKEQKKAALRSAGIFGWCVSELGPIAGPIAYSAMMATLMGLLNYALSFIGSGSSSKSTSGANTKVVSGMLTYDGGNVGRVIPMLDNGNVEDLHPYVDKDGSIYWATEDKEKEHKGVSLYDTPTATTINGQRALVAEKGPEIVIGRETTAAMQQNNPALLRAIYQYDRHHSGRIAYDRGNVAPVLGSSAAEMSGANALGASANIQRDPEMVAIMTALLERLNEPIRASINMYGRDGLYESNKKAQAFMKNR